MLTTLVWITGIFLAALVISRWVKGWIVWPLCVILAVMALFCTQWSNMVNMILPYETRPETIDFPVETVDDERFELYAAQLTEEYGEDMTHIDYFRENGIRSYEGPQTCEICHSFYSWKPAQFTEHDGIFPIFSGNHAGEWNECSDCHISPGNFQIFSCLNCHEHRKDRMDNEHREVNGYLYESNACYNCHPNGSAEGGDDD